MELKCEDMLYPLNLLKSQLIQPYWKIYNNQGPYGLGNKKSVCY